MSDPIEEECVLMKVQRVDCFALGAGGSRYPMVAWLAARG